MTLRLAYSRIDYSAFADPRCEECRGSGDTGAGAVCHCVPSWRVRHEHRRAADDRRRQQALERAQSSLRPARWWRRVPWRHVAVGAVVLFSLFLLAGGAT